MLIYFIVFAISTLFAYLAYKTKSKNKKIIYGICAILIPSILAGLRVMGIGTDTLYYINAAFEFSKMSSSFQQLMKISDIEIIYNLVNYIVSRFTTNINCLYFVLQLIICGFAYLACYKNRKNCPTWLSYLVFLLLFYNRSLNMCRQTISIVISLLAIQYAIEKKPIKFYLLILLAMGFHRTAIICLPFYFLVSILKKKESIVYKIILFLMFLLIFIEYENIMRFIIVDMGILSNRYLYYVSSETNNLILIESIFKIAILMIILMFSKSLEKQNDTNHIYIYLLILDVLLYHLGIYANYAQRFSYYFGYYIIFMLPQIKNAISNKKIATVIGTIIIIGTICYSYAYYEVAGYDETVPYDSIIDIGAN